MEKLKICCAFARYLYLLLQWPCFLTFKEICSKRSKCLNYGLLVFLNAGFC